ncbi:unnamed protein product [Symbiodinium natans]|uniref:Uncharacterized protein n=1 Tax=Symbiodinium natans TaxID=878477 RepID=A0A812QE64_9DINO|nr:unnamed protein product [Symbiodinium natans]
MTSAIAEADAEIKPQADWDAQAAFAPHVVTTADAVEYQVVIPTYRRWRQTQELAPNRQRFKDSKQAFILDYTLSFLTREAVPKSRVTLFVATDVEAANYREALQGSDWADVRITISAPGIRDSRNFIYKHFPADTYVVSLDDDIEGIKWKVREGTTDAACVDLPAGSFVKLVYDAYKRMKEHGAYLWGLSTSQNPRALSLTVCSLRNGLINGYLHGFICRPDAASDLLRRLSDAVEDAEFSVRHFAKDGVVLRYRMYAGRTSPFSNQGGLQSKFHAADARKTEEWCGAQQLHELFPTLIGAPSEEGESTASTTMQVKFIFGPVKRDLRTVRRLRGLGRFMVPILKAKKNRKGLSMLARAKAFITTGKKKASAAALDAEIAAKRKRRMASRAETAMACDRKIVSTSALDLMDEDKLRFAKNTKTPGSASYRRYAKYSKAQTVKEAIALGWRHADRKFDIAHGFAKIVMLDTKPASSECMVEDEKFVVPPVPSGRAVPIRLAEVVEKNPGIHLSRACIWPLLSRCPVFDVAAKGCWAKLAAPGGLLAEVPLPIFRILLHWGRTSCLAFARAQGPALLRALRRLGAEATALRIEQRLDKSALKFSTSSSGGVAVAAAEPVRCASSGTEGDVAGTKRAASAAKGSKKRGRARNAVEEPPSRVRAASLLQMAFNSKGEGITVAASQLACNRQLESKCRGEDGEVQETKETGQTCQHGKAVATLGMVAPQSLTDADKACTSTSSTRSTESTESRTDVDSTTQSLSGEPQDGREPRKGAAGAADLDQLAKMPGPSPTPLVAAKEGEVAVVLGGRVHFQRNLKSLFACRS